MQSQKGQIGLSGSWDLWFSLLGVTAIGQDCERLNLARDGSYGARRGIR
jgi:hypothetical protein